MNVYESWFYESPAPYLEGTSKGKWTKQLTVFHPNWSEWPHELWGQEEDHFRPNTNWSWFRWKKYTIQE